MLEMISVFEWVGICAWIVKSFIDADFWTSVSWHLPIVIKLLTVWTIAFARDELVEPDEYVIVNSSSKLTSDINSPWYFIPLWTNSFIS